MGRRRLLAVLLLLLLGGCAAGVGRPPAPAGELPSRIWPASGPARAVLLAVHGFNDHKGAFALLARELAPRGVTLVAYDQRGFGANPDRGFFPGWETLVLDLRAQLVKVREAYPGLPLFVLGESMGAAVVVAALSAPDAPRVRGAILAAPAAWGGRELPWLYRALLTVAAALAPDLRVTGASLGRRASDNLEVLQALARDPLFIRETRLAALRGLVALMDRAQERAPDFRLPVLVLVGARDEIVPPEVQRRFAQRLGSPLCRLVVYPDGWHLLFRDLQRARVAEDVLAWLEGRPLPSGLARACREPAGGRDQAG